MTITESAKQQLANIADGDARQALNLLEIAADLAENQLIDESILKKVTQTNLRRFDKQADFFHEQISALHKSVRGSHPDAARMRHCIGSRGCWMAVVILYISRDGLSGWPVKTLVMPIPAPYNSL